MRIRGSARRDSRPLRVMYFIKNRTGGTADTAQRIPVVGRRRNVVIARVVSKRCRFVCRFPPAGPTARSTRQHPSSYPAAPSCRHCRYQTDNAAGAWQVDGMALHSRRKIQRCLSPGRGEGRATWISFQEIEFTISPFPPIPPPSTLYPPIPPCPSLNAPFCRIKAASS